MTAPPAEDERRRALTAGIACQVIWSLTPLIVQAIGHLGVGAPEILAHRVFWSIPVAAAFVFMARQGRQALGVVRQPKVLGLLALTATLIGGNWLAFIWAVNNGRVLEVSLGVYINPLLNMALGVALLGERFDRIGMAAIGLAVIGVVLQTVALGRLPLVSVALAVSFAIYSLVRKQVAADAQTGLLVESVLLGLPGLAYVLWLQHSGAGHFLANPPTTALLIIAGPLTAFSMMLFAWSARRMPMSAMGFMLFIPPTAAFVIGVSQGEPFTLLRGVSFGFIWGGALVFVYGAWRRTRRLVQPPA
jgi:chloramphenicol-sensitive protein RarD